MKSKHEVKYYCEGIPINPDDWDPEDWQILWSGIQLIRRLIADRHRERMEAKRARPDP